jgi:hypothetical protein
MSAFIFRAFLIASWLLVGTPAESAPPGPPQATPVEPATTYRQPDSAILKPPRPCVPQKGGKEKHLVMPYIECDDATGHATLTSHGRVQSDKKDPPPAEPPPED